MARPRKNNAEYFSHDASMRNHRRIRAVRSKFGHVGYSVWCMTLELLTESDNNELDRSDQEETELIACDFDVSVTEINDIWDFCVRIKLLQINDAGKLHSANLDERLSVLYSKRDKNMNKFNWHRKNKSVVFEETNGVCERCLKQTTINGGVVHHKTYKYKDSVYNYDGIELLQNNIVGWFCHDCHEWIHSNYSIDGITKILYKYCKSCEQEITTTDPHQDVCDDCANVNELEQRWQEEELLK